MADQSTSTSKVDKPETDGQVSSDFKSTRMSNQKILDQYLNEKLYAIKVRQVKINNWIRNEELYNGVTQRTLLTRSNLHIPKVFEGVHTMSSRLGQMPSVEYHTIPEGDENAAEIMKHVVKEDMDASNFALIYEASKIECGIYGRTIYKLIPGEKGNSYELVDTMSYLISPIAKDCDDALYQGQQFIYKTLPELEDEADEMGYDKKEIKRIKDQKIPNETQQDTSSEASLKNIRLANMGLANVTQYGSKVVEITEWYTYLNQDADGVKGENIPYVLTVANDQFLLRAVKLEEVGLEKAPYVSWGAFPRGITFWCPSVADVLRDPNLAMNVTMNQLIDNNTYRNFGMLFVASSSGLKQSSIVPRPLGITPVTVGPNEDIKSKVFQNTPPEISSAASTLQIINGIAESSAGLSVPSTGKGKVSVTQQAQMQAQLEMRTNLMRQQATLAFEKLCQMSANVIKKNLTVPRRVKIFGYNQLTIEDVTKKNFKDVELIAKASASETSQENKAIKQKAKIELYELFKDDPKVPGQLSLRRSVAKTFDVPPTEIESWFTKEEEPLATAPVAGAEAGKVGADGKPAPTPASPLLAQTGAAAAAAVPAAIK